MTEVLAFLGVIGVGILIAKVSGLNRQIESLNLRMMQLSQDLKNMAKPATEVETKVETENPLVEKVTVPYTTIDHRAYMPQESFTEMLADELKPEQKTEPEVQEAIITEQVKTVAEHEPIVMEQIPEHPNPTCR